MVDTEISVGCILAAEWRVDLVTTASDRWWRPHAHPNCWPECATLRPSGNWPGSSMSCTGAMTTDPMRWLRRRPARLRSGQRSTKDP